MYVADTWFRLSHPEWDQVLSTHTYLTLHAHPFPSPAERHLSNPRPPFIASDAIYLYGRARYLTSPFIQPPFSPSPAKPSLQPCQSTTASPGFESISQREQRETLVISHKTLGIPFTPRTNPPPSSPMPADYRSTAEGLAVSPSRQDSSPSPPWSRRLSTSENNNHTSSNHRLSGTRIRLSTAGASSSSSPNGSSESLYRRTVARLEAVNAQAMRTFWRLTPLQRALAAVAVVVGYAFIILAWVYSHKFFGWLSGVSASWRELPGGWLIVFALVFVSAFPPMIGYSTANTIAGFVFGFPLGWPIVAVACVAGSLCAFLASRTVLSRYVDRMVGKDPRFVALGQVLRRDGIWYLTGIRFSPLPFSLSNGFLATIPSITPASFALSTALST